MLMRFVNLTKQDLELVKKAKEQIKERKSKRSAVAASLRTGNNKVFCGVNIEIEASAP